MDQKVQHEITRKNNSYTVDYIQQFEEAWNKTVAMIKASNRDLSKIMITKRAG